MSPEDVRATVVDLTSGEAAAVSLFGGLYAAIKAISAGLETKGGAEQVEMFHSVFFARYVGTVAARHGVENTLQLLDATTRALRESKPEMEREAAARRGKAH